MKCKPVTVAGRSKAWTVSAWSKAGIVGSNPTQGMDVFLCLFCVCVSSGLATGWSLIQGVLPTVLGLRNCSEIRVSRMPYTPKWGQQERQIKCKIASSVISLKNILGSGTVITKVVMSKKISRIVRNIANSELLLPLWEPKMQSSWWGLK
jgi:hypothetical protein